MPVFKKSETPEVGGPDYRTLEGLVQHPLYQLLTLRQQAFVRAFIESKGNREFAVKQAGLSSKRPDVEAMKQLRTAYIRKLIATYYGYDVDQTPMSRTELAGLIAARLRMPGIKDTDFRHLSEQLISLMEHRRHRGRPRKDEGEQVAQDAESEIDKLVKQIEKEKQDGA
jgi:phage terminase small subunit